jgi:hypothetical protein
MQLQARSADGAGTFASRKGAKSSTQHTLTRPSEMQALVPHSLAGARRPSRSMAGPGQVATGGESVASTLGSVPSSAAQTNTSEGMSVVSLQDGIPFNFRSPNEQVQTTAPKPATVQTHTSGDVHAVFPTFSADTTSTAFAIELCSGTAGLTAALRACGLEHSIGVDHIVKAGCRAPVCRLDITAPHAQDMVRDWLRLPSLV